MLYLQTWLTTRLARMRGQGMVEYALILVLVAVVVVVVLSTLGTAIGGVFSNVVKCLNTRSC